VIGGGSWGTAVARLLARGGHRTTLACRDAAQAEMISRRHRNPRYLYDIELPPDLDASPIGETSFDGAELVHWPCPAGRSRRRSQRSPTGFRRRRCCSR